MGPGKPADSSSSSSVCKYDSNGNQDRVKLSDFNFIMVLGKGSFGKVMHVRSGSRRLEQQQQQQRQQPRRRRQIPPAKLILLTASR